MDNQSIPEVSEINMFGELPNTLMESSDPKLKEKYDNISPNKDLEQMEEFINQ